MLSREEVRGCWSLRRDANLRLRVHLLAEALVSCHYSTMLARSWRDGTPANQRLSFPRKLSLLARVWRTAIHVQLALWRRPLSDVIEELGSLDGSARVPIGLLSRAVSRGLRIGAWQPRCLVRSLVLYRLLRAQGDAAELIIGLQDRPTSSDAHAWVEFGGWDVGPVPGGAGYQELTRYPRGRWHESRPSGG